MTYTIAVCTVKNSWWWTEEMSKTCSFYSKNKFEKLLHLVGFILRIYHDAQSPECQKCTTRVSTKNSPFCPCSVLMSSIWILLESIILLYSSYWFAFLKETQCSLWDTNWISLYDTDWGMWWCSWLRHCPSTWKVMGSIPNGVNGIFHWRDTSDHPMALVLPQPLTQMCIRGISWG